MTDASKRCMTEEDAPARQMPVIRATKGRAPTSLHKEWGRTLVTAGSFDKQDLCYSELESSGETSKVKYVQWMINQGGRSDLSPEVQDMTSYFVAYAREKEADGPCVPGSSVTRKYKA